MIRFAICACFVLSVVIADAKPLITSSVETVAGICLAREDAPERLVDACDAALSGAGLTASQRVELMVARADAFLWLDDLEAAEAGYRAATAADPRSYDAWNGLGWVLRETSDDEAAFEAFETSLEIDVSMQGLGARAATGRTTGRITGAEAREILRAALTIDPEYSWALREIGWSHIDDSQPGAAADAFWEALEIDPDDGNARYGLGRALLSSGEADRRWKPSTKFLPASPIISRRGSTESSRCGNWTGTHRRCGIRIGLSRNSRIWHRAISSGACPSWRCSAALGVIDRAIGLSGSDFTDHLLKSWIALELEDYALAREAAEASIGTGTEDPWAHYYVAISMVHSGQTEEGLGRFDQAMETGLPEDRVGAFAKELISAGKYVEAAQLRLKY